MESFALIVKDFGNAILIFVSSGLFMDELRHGMITLVFAGVFYYKTKSIKYSFFILLITYLIDLDHLVDYWLYYGAGFSFSNFISLNFFKVTKRAVVPFHAWEWVIMLILLAYDKIKEKRLFFASLAVGILSHLIWDMMTVESFWFYSIIFRVSKNFIVI